MTQAAATLVRRQIVVQAPIGARLRRVHRAVR